MCCIYVFYGNLVRYLNQQKHQGWRKKELFQCPWSSKFKVRALHTTGLKYLTNYAGKRSRWIKIFTFEWDIKWHISFSFFFAKDDILGSVWFRLVLISVQKAAVLPQNALDKSCFLRNTPSRTHHTLQVSLTLRSTGSLAVMKMTLLTQLCHHGNSSLTEGGVGLRFHQFHFISFPRYWLWVLINKLYVGNQTKLQAAGFVFFHLPNRCCVTFVLHGCLFLLRLFSKYLKITKGVFECSCCRSCVDLSVYHQQNNIIT